MLKTEISRNICSEYVFLFKWWCSLFKNNPMFSDESSTLSSAVVYCTNNYGFVRYFLPIYVLSSIHRKISLNNYQPRSQALSNLPPFSLQGTGRRETLRTTLNNYDNTTLQVSRVGGVVVGKLHTLPLTSRLNHGSCWASAAYDPLHLFSKLLVQQSINKRVDSRVEQDHYVRNGNRDFTNIVGC